MYVFIKLMETYQSESTEKKFILFSFIFIINSTYDLIKLPIIANIIFVHVRQTKNVIKLRDKITSDFKQI